MGGYEVVVVGTGVVGMAIAVAAADAGLRVALVGPGYNAGGAASPAAGAMLGVVGEYTVADQDMTDLVFRHHSALLWPDWIEAITEHTGIVSLVRANQPSPSARYGLQTQRPDPDPTSQGRQCPESCCQYSQDSLARIGVASV